jgi:hypothetical protein
MRSQPEPFRLQCGRLVTGYGRQKRSPVGGNGASHGSLGGNPSTGGSPSDELELRPGRLPWPITKEQPSGAFCRPLPTLGLLIVKPQRGGNEGNGEPGLYGEASSALRTVPPGSSGSLATFHWQGGRRKSREDVSCPT